MHSTKYIYIFVLIMTSVVALSLASLSFGLKDIHDKNEAIYNKKAILSAIEEHLAVEFTTIGDDQVQDIFDSQIEQTVIDYMGNIIPSENVEARGYGIGRAEDVDMAKEKKRPIEEQLFPLFVYTKDDGKKYYILTVRGNGLWDEIWGCIALEEDMNTIAGVAFDHKAETPGLGAEIKDNTGWKSQFSGKKINNDAGDFISIDVVKGGADDDDEHAVDGLTGATITANGVDKMLEKGLAYYRPYLDKIN